MGEYFDWVNIDKKEYLCPADFDLGSKRFESMQAENALLRALRELLSESWAGDRLIFLGDECLGTEYSVSNTALDIIIADAHEYEDGYLYDGIYERYRNVSALFAAAENDVRREIGYYLEDVQNGSADAINEYGIDISDPYRGLFVRQGASYVYTLDHTKRCAYSLAQTKVLYSDGTAAKNTDPLPWLMGYGRSLDPGIWLGDAVGVSDVLPQSYELLREIQLDWCIR